MDTEQLPAAALADYAEYCRMGGRFELRVWWERYKDDYAAESSGT